MFWRNYASMAFIEAISTHISSSFPWIWLKFFLEVAHGVMRVSVNFKFWSVTCFRSYCLKGAQNPTFGAISPILVVGSWNNLMERFLMVFCSSCPILVTFLRKLLKLWLGLLWNSAWPKIDANRLSYRQLRGVIDDRAPPSARLPNAEIFNFFGLELEFSNELTENKKRTRVIIVFS